ncbi:MAG: signal recognition particle protein [Candidatus Goldiibacteriota bacterium]
MFETVSSKLDSVFRKIKGEGIISEKNIEDAVKQIRLSLLEADVSYKVVKEFISCVKEKAMGESVLRSLSPGQQFTKIVKDELVRFLGDTASPPDYSKKPLLIMLIGLQGSGKTTTAAKLAAYFKKEKDLKRIMLVGADTYRPAAKEQLEKLSSRVGAEFYTERSDDSVKIVKNAYEEIQKNVFDAAVFDTAGRLHIDDELINELKNMKASVPFGEILLVGDAMLGQESVNIAKSFNDALGITGIILTKIDGDARGGAALSMKHITNVPIKFMGTGEKTDRLEPFHPDRIASRILGMGDVVSLAEKVQKNATEQDAKAAEEKIRKASFTFEDFLEQMKMMRNMGGLEEIMKMIPGAGKMGLDNMSIDEKEIKHIEAIILSMTPRERAKPDLLNPSRKKRIAKGSGLPLEKINKFIKQFERTKKMMKKMGKKKRGGGGGLPFGGGMPF